MSEKRTCGECRHWGVSEEAGYGECDTVFGKWINPHKDFNATDCPAFERKEKA